MNHKILHLCTDGNFIENSISVFEHFYPDQNFFYVKPPKNRINNVFVKSPKAIWFDPNENLNYLDNIKKQDDIVHFDIIVVHGVYDAFNKIIRYINIDKKKKVYWLFWGYELFYSLGELDKYPLLDTKSPFSIMSWITPTKYYCLVKTIFHKGLFHKWLNDFLPLADYFCFWLEEDYNLLMKFYSYDIKFRYFQYSAYYKSENSDPLHLYFDKNEREVRIGHQASKTGNHLTVMKLLKRIDRNNEYKKIVPLSYGSQYVKKMVLKYGKNYFGDKFVPITDYVNREEYLKTLQETGVAIFGQLRQEASGNIHPLIKYGAKVFLRKNNSLYNFYKRKGYIVFSVEDDLKTIDDLCPLTHEQMIHNAETAIKNRVYYEDFMPSLFNESL